MAARGPFTSTSTLYKDGRGLRTASRETTRAGAVLGPASYALIAPGGKQDKGFVACGHGRCPISGKIRATANGCPPAKEGATPCGCALTRDPVRAAREGRPRATRRRRPTECFGHDPWANAPVPSSRPRTAAAGTRSGCGTTVWRDARPYHSDGAVTEAPGRLWHHSDNKPTLYADGQLFDQPEPPAQAKWNSSGARHGHRGDGAGHRAALSRCLRAAVEQTTPGTGIHLPAPDGRKMNDVPMRSTSTSAHHGGGRARERRRDRLRALEAVLNRG